jgi:hypothetical protein
VGWGCFNEKALAQSCEGFLLSHPHPNPPPRCAQGREEKTGYRRLAGYPRPTNGIFDAITVRNRQLASGGRVAM